MDWLAGLRHYIPGFLFSFHFFISAIKAPGREWVHCIPGLSYEATKDPGIETVHCTPGISYKATQGLSSFFLYLGYSENEIDGYPFSESVRHLAVVLIESPV